MQGNAQGLAVYVNGARFNQSFDDTVNWNLIPSIAINSTTVEGPNPVFGLNALGGSISVNLKNGFTFHGSDLTAYGGSFGRASVLFEDGRQSDNFATYFAANWITHSSADILYSARTQVIESPIISNYLLMRRICSMRNTRPMAIMLR